MKELWTQETLVCKLTRVTSSCLGKLQVKLISVNFSRMLHHHLLLLHHFCIQTRTSIFALLLPFCWCSSTVFDTRATHSLFLERHVFSALLEKKDNIKKHSLTEKNGMQVAIKTTFSVVLFLRGERRGESLVLPHRVFFTGMNKASSATTKTNVSCSFASLAWQLFLLFFSNVFHYFLCLLFRVSCLVIKSLLLFQRIMPSFLQQKRTNAVTVNLFFHAIPLLFSSRHRHFEIKGETSRNLLLQKEKKEELVFPFVFSRFCVDSLNCAEESVSRNFFA